MAEPSTSTEMVRVPILGENGRISDDYIPASIPQAVTAAEQAAESAASSASQALQQAAAAEKAASSATGSVEQAKTYANNASTYMSTAESHAESAATDAQAASGSASAAAASATAAEESNKSAAQSSADAMGFRNNAVQYRDQAREAAQEAQGYVTTVKQLEQNATNSATAALNSATSASASAETATTAATQASASATNAAASAQTASEKAASVLDHYIESATATTLEPGQQATASVVDKVLQLGIPKGDKGDPGDVSAVTAAEGSDLSVSTDEGTVTIDDSALRERIAELENQAANVVTGTSTDLVAHGEDAYAQKPIEVRVKGKTWVNRWPTRNDVTLNGVSVSIDETGLITISGTATALTFITIGVAQGAAPKKQYTLTSSRAVTGLNIKAASYNAEASEVSSITLTTTTTTTTGTTSSDMVELRCILRLDADLTYNASFRVMLVDGTEAPDCFTPPASITSVEAGNLVTAGKNLLKTSSVISGDFGTSASINDDGSYHLSGTTNRAFEGPIRSVHLFLTKGTYTLSGRLASINSKGYFYAQILIDKYYTTAGGNVTFTITKNGFYSISFTAPTEGATFEGDFRPQLELGSTATAYEPPTVTQTPLPEVELRSLPNGTCDELVIKADGTCEVERRLAQKTIDAEHPITVGLFTPASGTSLPWVTVGHLFDQFDAPGDSIDRTTYSTSWPYTENLKSRGVYRTWNSTIFVDERFTDKGTAQSIINETGGTFVAQVPSSTEPQSPVTLPTLPAPTFNQYHDADVPSDTSTEYARDINIVLANLEAKVSELSVNQASN